MSTKSICGGWEGTVVSRGVSVCLPPRRDDTTSSCTNSPSSVERASPPMISWRLLASPMLKVFFANHCRRGPSNADTINSTTQSPRRVPVVFEIKAGINTNYQLAASVLLLSASSERSSTFPL